MKGEIKSFEKFQESMLQIINEALTTFPSPLNMKASGLIPPRPSTRNLESLRSYARKHDISAQNITKESLEELLKIATSDYNKDESQLFAEKIASHEFWLAKTSAGINLSKEELRSLAESKIDRTPEEIKNEHIENLASIKEEIVGLITQLDDYESKMENLKYTLIFLHSEGFLKTINTKGRHYLSNPLHATRVDPTTEGKIYNNLEGENFILTSRSLAILNKQVGNDKKPLYKTINEWVESAFTISSAAATTAGIVSTFLGG